MDQDRTDRQDASTGRTASEDTSRAEEHVRNAEENRDALEAQNRRTESTTPGETDRPIEGSRAAHGGFASAGTDRGTGRSDPTLSGGMEAAAPRRTTEDTSEAESNVREAERNRDALEAQHRRVESTAPADVEMP
jgi:hypothetical protein